MTQPQQSAQPAPQAPVQAPAQPQVLYTHIVRKDIIIPITRIAIGTLGLIVAWVLLQVLLSGVLIPLFSNAFSAAPSAGQPSMMNSASLVISFVLVFSYLLYIVGIIMVHINDYYMISPDVIKIKKGIIFSSQTVYDLKNVKSFQIEEGLLGKIFRFGDLKCLDDKLAPIFILHHIPNPAFYAEVANTYHHQKRDGIMTGAPIIQQAPVAGEVHETPPQAPFPMTPQQHAQAHAVEQIPLADHPPVGEQAGQPQVQTSSPTQSPVGWVGSQGSSQGAAQPQGGQQQPVAQQHDHDDLPPAAPINVTI